MGNLAGQISCPQSGDGVLSGDITSNLNGGSGAVAFYPNRWLGAVADFGGYKLSSLKQGSQSVDVSGTVFSYLFGPRVRFAAGKITPFAQVLFGGAHLGNISGSACGTSCTLNSSESSFAMAAEGGVDIKASGHLSVRGQGGYLMTRFNGGSGGSFTQNNARISVGAVIH
jgi:hypothetical protein